MEDILSNSDSEEVEEQKIEPPPKQEKPVEFPATYIFRDVTEGSSDNQKSARQATKSRIW